MSIPLVQEATKDAINTSIIAIKRNIERINMLLGLSNSEEIDTSEFVKKSNIVDEVTVGNMQSVTSNAVAEAVGTYYQSGSYSYTEDGVKMLLPAYVSSSSTSLVFMLPIIHDSNKTVNFTNIGLACRTGFGGYVEGSGARKINMSDYNFTFTDRGRFGITVSIVKKNGTAWQNATTSANVTNNTGCIVSITDLEFTIS